ncbi:hypothetical protein Gogos_015269 [Gossypium gossypioides]|uniref:Uncharacterized protein n=1 Tax=Gossypium gossypioides TaxID=34282 RepID=A0A7J9C187_GOSGO|nr:hypothetical protein [Gossypium gossypioides]
MKAYIKSIDERACRSALTNQQALMLESKAGRVLKSELEQTIKEERVVNANTKVLYVIFCGVDLHEFKRISRRFKRFKAFTNSPKNKDKGVVIKEEAEKENKGIQCNECLGYGHILAKCVVLGSKVNIDGESDGGSKKEFIKTYKTMLRKWENVCDMNAQLLQEEKDEENSKFKELATPEVMLEKFNASSGKLDEIVIVGRRDLDKGGIGYVRKGKEFIKSPTIFVKTLSHEEFGGCSTKPMLTKITMRLGYVVLAKVPTLRGTFLVKKKKLVWRKKEPKCLLVAYHSLKTSFGDVWAIVGKGTLDVSRMPNLKNELLVDSLHANLVRIIQLYDHCMLVHFTNDKCVMPSKLNEKIMECAQAFDNDTICLNLSNALRLMFLN